MSSFELFTLLLRNLLSCNLHYAIYLPRIQIVACHPKIANLDIALNCFHIVLVIFSLFP